MLLAINDQHTTFTHEVIERVSHNRVHRHHGLLRNAHLLLLVRLHLLHNAVDVGVERIRITASLWFLLGGFLLLLLELSDTGTVLKSFLLLVGRNHGYNDKKS